MEAREKYPQIVQRALDEGHVTDLGQLTGEEAKALKAAVQNGVLKKGKGGGFPAVKTVYARPDFDIEGHHAAELSKLKRDAAMDSVVRVMKENDPKRS
jgi:hypothetical protein